ncbi:pentatricopeptide repeat-containing protein [Tanacetum coccineum]
MYIKCSNINYAHKVFDKMPQNDTVSYNGLVFGYAGIDNMGMARLIHVRDVVLWNSLLTGYLQNRSCWKCINVFMSIKREDVKIDATTFLCRLEDYRLGVQVHGLIVRMGFLNDVVARSATVDMYAKCRKLKESVRFFDEMSVKNWVSWSALIAGCVQNDEYLDGLKLPICVRFRLFSSYMVISLNLIENYGSDTIVETATLEMYAKCGRLCDAKKLFHKLSIHNLQSYNAIIIGCARIDQGLEALQLFHYLMNTNLGFDDITLSGVFSTCGAIKSYTVGVQLHWLTIKSMLQSNVCVENAILDMYGICGALAEARSVFEEMQIRDVVSWNAIIAAYEQNGNVDETLHLLVWMLSSGLEPDEFTFDSVLKACDGLQSLNDGIELAEKLHERMEEETMVSWNAIISGFSLQEQSEEAQKFFSQMLEVGAKPDNFTFATVLDTCANLATISLGRQIHGQIIKQEM